MNTHFDIDRWIDARATPATDLRAPVIHVSLYDLCMQTKRYRRARQASRRHV